MSIILSISIILISTVSGAVLLNIFSNWLYDWLVKHDYLPDKMGIRLFLFILFVLVFLASLPQILEQINLPKFPTLQINSLIDWSEIEWPQIKIENVLRFSGIIAISLGLTWWIRNKKRLQNLTQKTNALSKPEEPFKAIKGFAPINADNWSQVTLVGDVNVGLKISCIDIHPESKSLAVGTPGGQVMVLDLTSGDKTVFPREKISESLTPFQRNITDIKYSKDGKHVYSVERVSAGHIETWTWDIELKQSIGNPTIDLTNQKALFGLVNEIHSPNNDWKVYSKIVTEKERDPYERGLLRLIPNYVKNQYLEIWNTKTNTLIKRNKIKNTRGYKTAAFTNNNKIFILLSDYPKRTRHIQEHKSKRNRRKNKDHIPNFFYTESSTIEAFNTSTWAQLPTLEAPDSVLLEAITFSPDDTLLAGFYWSTVFFWGIMTEKTISQHASTS